MAHTVIATISHNDWDDLRSNAFHGLDDARVWFDSNVDHLVAMKVGYSNHVVDVSVVDTLNLIRLQTYIDGVLFARRYGRGDIEDQLAEEYAIEDDADNWEPWDDDAVPAMVDRSACFDDVPSDVRFRQAM